MKPVFGIVLLLFLLAVFGCSDPKKENAVSHEGHTPSKAKEPVSELQKEAEDFFAAEGTAAAGKERKLLFYRNPMNPAITSSVPAKDEMGMDYIPVYDDEVKGLSAGGPADMAPVVLTGQGMELSGVATSPAVSEHFARTIRTVGRVVADETRIHRVQTRVSGWVEKLHVNFTGRMVTQGTPLLSVYSPELLAGQEELISALKAVKKRNGSAGNEEKKVMDTLVESARKRLQLFDVPESFIAELEKKGEVHRAITLEAPATGFVTSKEVFEGQRIEPGMALFTVSDLSLIWVEAEFYEYEAGELKIGQAAELSSPYDPGLTFKGEMTYIYPYLDVQSRTLRARMEFDNPDLKLKPGMFVDVILNVDLGPSLVIPDSAVMYSGVRRIVFVNTEGRRFEPREILIGGRSGGKAQVLSGLSEGDRVAVKANFLLDSESRLQAMIQGAAKEAAHD